MDLPQHYLNNHLYNHLHHHLYLQHHLHHTLLPAPRVKRLHSHIGGSIQEVTISMFANVSKEVTNRLEQVFRLDLEMFGYLPY